MKIGPFEAVALDAAAAAEALTSMITEHFFCVIENNPKGIPLVVAPWGSPSPHKPGHATSEHNSLTVVGVIDTTGGCGSVRESTPDNWQADPVMCPHTAVAVVVVEDADAPGGRAARLEPVDFGPEGFKRKPKTLHWGGRYAGTIDNVYTDVLDRVMGRPTPLGLLPVYDSE
ncbi:MULTISPECIES: hypothetical protein [Nocardia]|uniref:hypothetical protein n=1 Tax=Nocardia TaxID=1817 RepID=UPI002457F13B|nr:MULTISPECIES: hypothetical protein [Nocardia]